MMLLIRTGPEYVVKLLERPSKLDSASSQALTQPTPFVSQQAQQIAESTTIYYYHYFNQQSSIFEAEWIDMSASILTVDGLVNNTTTYKPEGDATLSSSMAATTPGWPYPGLPGCAASDAVDNMFLQGSPLSELYEMPDEINDWAILMQQDMLATGDFDMTGLDFPSTMETDYQAPGCLDVLNDPTVQYDIEQSLLPDMFDFNAPLPDLSASGYLSSTDQVSSYLGSANTSPYEPSLDFFPDATTYSSFPASAEGSPLGTSSPGSDAAPAAAHPWHCTTDGCTKTFRKEAQLKQHQRVHRKALVCTICRAEHRTEHKFAQVRDLERHLQARHKDVAERTNVRSEIRQCPHPGCEHEGRRDNVSRHHKSKHGKELKWKRGVPHVVG
ncbi:hypothetical protein CCHL11_07013 [Colletotrichum chlorophyti]|uniref:C2H2-type domain-containing protein n=1 Tax=Colletotrichum chlorophyti TaxID=708187 RepID=A0A1Q8RC22_9PEZI|nr:hypothetical protein CCHL11_07013 [Colletotrichum chlorophyti]